jgi:hypothetical protein
MHKLGVLFFRCYYHILLKDPNTIVLAAENNTGCILGFVAGCSNARVEINHLKNHRVMLLASCLWQLLSTPSLIRDLHARKDYIENPLPESWSGHNDPRISFWCWDPDSTAARSSTVLLQFFIDYMRKSGAKVVRFEVDRVNRKVFITHKLMGARTVEVFNMPDGRERLLMEHVLNPDA